MLTNSLGPKTFYRHAIVGSEYRLLEVRGPGCASCGQTDVRYAYDRLGLLMETTTLDEQGKPLQTVRNELDGYGRTVSVSRIAYRGGKPGPAQRQVRYEYEVHQKDGMPGYQPVLIARPRVVPGKEHQVRILYNSAHQPASITESGWSPAVDGNDKATPIERTTVFRYSEINGRSVLSEIDGPLSNGPANSPVDSDITRLAWDRTGSFVTVMTTPGGFASTVAYADAGRLKQVQNAEGMQTAFTYGARNQPVSVSHTAPGWAKPKVASYQYDALGNLVEAGSGSPTDKIYRSRTKSAFDAQGRSLWTASALGILERRHYDTESRLTEISRHNASMAQVQRYTHDAYGRLTAAWDNTGAAMAVGYNVQGMPEVVTDALGRSRRINDASAAPGTMAEPNFNRGRIHHRKDDFGRIVATLSPDSGTTTRSFDEADRLIGGEDAMGNRAVYEYDATGRIARQTMTDKRTGQMSVTAWRYQGKHLVALDHPTQSEQYRYDERGLLLAKTVRIKSGNGGEIVSVTRYVYDDDGVLHSVSLPDGSRIEYDRNGQGQVTAVKRNLIHTGWLQWLLPAKSLVADLRRDLVGLKHYRTGNGIEADIQRSREGILARIVYRSDQPALSAAASVPDWLIGVANASETSGKAPVHSSPGALGMPTDPKALLDLRYLWDAQGNLLHKQQKAGSPAFGSYAYDRDDQLIVAVQADKQAVQASRYFHDRQGRTLLSQQGITDQRDLKTNTEKALYQSGTHRWLGQAGKEAEYDGGGQPERIGHRGYRWDGLGRLVEVSEDGKALARYTYNHRGERIAKDSGGITYYLYQDKQLIAELDARGNIRRQYVYLGDQPIAVIDSAKGKAPASEEQGAFGRIGADLATLWRVWLADDERMTWLHVNHLGAVEVATAEDGKLVWRATYQPSGKAHVAGKNFALNLRLPGQYEDAETGLHYNRHRYYDPRRGAYLTPDPLGAPDGPNPYAYVRGNPLRYIDPSGLILFAFDGTGNSDPVLDGATQSNVVKFRDLYEDGKPYYITGPGTKDPATGIENPQYKGGNPTDVIESFTGKERITAMIDYLDQYSGTVDDETAFNIDIVGFSRGSAQARDFANQIVGNYQDGYYRYQDKQGKNHCQKVNFRFMGLFDTVLSEHAGSYQLRIPDAFEYVAQAVALNEYRGNLVKFPLESIMGVPASNDRTRIERGFLGSHSDIGGSFAQDDLAKVALVWMVDQATAAGVKMDDPSRTIIANPVLHDKSSNLLFGAPEGGPTATSEDREVRYMDGTTAKQRKANTFGMSWADTTQFITYKTDPNSIDNISGTVDMKGYLQWLKDNHYDIDMTVQ